MNPTDDAAPSEALTDPSAAAAVDPSRLGELAVEVELVAARGRFTLAEVAQWRVGEVVTLPAPLGEPVEVVAGGRVVALGELVVVEGALGVRLTELR